MKNNPFFLRTLHTVYSSFCFTIKSFILGFLIFAGVCPQLQAQESTFTKPSWYFGAAAGANFNFYRGSTKEISPAFTSFTTFEHGKGVGLYLAPLIEFHRPNSLLGFMFQAGYDNRKGNFDQNIISPCNCPADLSAKLSYISLEPSLRLTPFKSGFYLYAGPRLAFNLASSFKYVQGTNPDFPDQVPPPDVEGDFGDVRSTIVSMQVGAGYDIPISSRNKSFQAVLSPFVAFQPYFGQNPRSTETWTVTTIRAGAALKFGRGSRNTPSGSTVKAVTLDPAFKFTVKAPSSIPTEYNVREVFPIRNYVYFNTGSTEIPDRYVLLKKGQVNDFKEDQLAMVAPTNLSGRSIRQMFVYYNVINILADRMGKNPSTTVKLVGSSEKGPADARLMAESIKEYMVSIFGIDASRITTEGRDKPKIPSEQSGSTKDLALLHEGDRRVSIEGSSPDLFGEFQSGTNAQLKPVEIFAIQETPLNSYVTFNVEGAKKAFSSWSLEIMDDKGKVQSLGPYTQESVRLPGKTIMGTKPEGTYKVTMTGITESGHKVKNETSVHMVLWNPPTDKEAMRFSVIFEFDESKAPSIYEKYLTEVVAPKISAGGTIIIHGHTDIIGDEAYNTTLSFARANEVKTILANSLSKAGRSDVTFEVYGFGEDQNIAPFNNKFPEERAYNRTVIIDVIPGK